MKAETTPDGKFIQIIEYTDTERKQLKSSFTKQVANWRFIKKKFNGSWDGYIEFIDNYMRIPIGLWKKLQDICEKFNMPLEWKRLDGVHDKDFDDDEFRDWVAENFKDSKKKPRDYQIESALRIMKYMKTRSEIATSAGKTLIIYMIYQFLKDKGKLDGHKMLIVVPTTSLIIQTAEEFEDYSEMIGISPPLIQMMHGGKSKEKVSANIVIGTFQTLTKLPREFFNDINVVCIDEAHFTNAKSVKTIIQMAIHAEYRFGVSGTLKNTDDANSFTLDAYLGPEINNISAKFLIDNDYATSINVKMIFLKYNGYDINKQFYQLRNSPMAKEGSKLLALEKNYVVENKERMDFLTDALIKTTKNTLVLFSDIKYGFGKRLFNWLTEHARDKKVMYADGGTSTEERQKYIHLMEKSDDKILIASFGTFSTGISIDNIHNIFFTESYKSDRIIKQSIGRGMRLLKNKHSVNIIDLVDDLSYPGSRRSKNYLYNHGMERYKIYMSEGHKVSKYKVNLINPKSDTLF